jgi:ABC-2 type transport system ATP-binding protein
MSDRSTQLEPTTSLDGEEDAVVMEALGLTHRYEDGVLALDALDLVVRAGEIYCLLGANGAGKTTTLNLFLGFLRPTSGRIRVAGIDVLREPVKARQHMAYLSENVQLYGNFSARWNLAFFARLSGRCDLGPKDFDRALREVGLPETTFEQKVRTFSKGMRQKLALAIAIVKDASALFLDEPLSGLDPRAALEMAETFQELRLRGKALLLSTHDIFRARELADRVGILKEGRKVVERSRAELAEEDLERLYFDYVRGGLPHPPGSAGGLETRDRSAFRP